MQTLKSLLLFLLFFCPFNISAQEVFKGALGKAIFTDDFGSGIDSVGSKLPDGITSYRYVNKIPDDGDYTISKGTLGYYNNPGGWHQVTNHTADINGYMLIVCAAVNTGVFYQRTISNLCPNNKYEISAWIISLPNYITNSPNITVSIETTSGDIIKQINKGDIISPGSANWIPYQEIFAIGNRTEVVLKLISNNPGGPGNDFGVDDITISPCVPTILPTINTSETNINICKGTPDIFNLSAEVSDGYDAPEFQWQINKGSGWNDFIGETTTALSVQLANEPEGTYQYRLVAAEKGNITSLNCRIISNPLIININGNGSADAGADQTILAGKSAMLNGKITGDSVTYYWTPSLYLDSATKLNPTTAPPTNMVYTLHAISPFGCTSTDQVSITVKPNIVITNTFTPNGDGINDTWNIPTAESFANTVLRITNRYGQLVYQSTGKFKPWDGKFNGKDLPSAAYYYTLNFNNGLSIYSGWVMIIR